MITRKSLPGVMLAVEGTLEDLERRDVSADTKWDGTRLLLIKMGSIVRLFVARGKHTEYTEKYPDVVAEGQKLNCKSCILDGEFVFMTKKEHDFFLPISANPETIGNKIYHYMVFDIIKLNGMDLRKTGIPLKQRQMKLMSIIPSHLKLIKRNPVIEKNFKKFYADQIKKSREGIMLKEVNSPYRSERSKEWLKIKYKRDIDVLVKGGTVGTGFRKPYFGALHCFYPIRGVLTYVGDVGTGFSDDELRIIRVLLRRKKSFVIQVKFYEFSQHDHMRFPVFVRLRPDKNLYDVMKSGG